MNSTDLINKLKERKDETLKDILTPDEFAQRGQIADKIALELKEKMKPTQLRRFFHAIKEKERTVKGKNDDEKLGQKTKSEIRLLIPEIAYARGRKLITQDFYELMQICLSSGKLEKVGDLRILMQFLTAIIAYHKFHEKVKDGGRE